MSEDVLLSGMADDRSFLPNQNQKIQTCIWEEQSPKLPGFHSGLLQHPCSSAPKSLEAHNQDSGICGLNFKPLPLQTAGL